MLIEYWNLRIKIRLLIILWTVHGNYSLAKCMDLGHVRLVLFILILFKQCMPCDREFGPLHSVVSLSYLY